MIERSGNDRKNFPLYTSGLDHAHDNVQNCMKVSSVSWMLSLSPV